jgi:hypothetical protein
VKQGGTKTSKEVRAEEINMALKKVRNSKEINYLCLAKAFDCWWVRMSKMKGRHFSQSR